MKNRIWYSLNVEDIQEVAQTDFNRILTDDEVERVIRMAPNGIQWYDVISIAIGEL